jgi:hypothetical protein
VPAAPFVPPIAPDPVVPPLAPAPVAPLPPIPPAPPGSWPPQRVAAMPQTIKTRPDHHARGMP